MKFLISKDYVRTYKESINCLSRLSTESVRNTFNQLADNRKTKTATMGRPKKGEMEENDISKQFDNFLKKAAIFGYLTYNSLRNPSLTTRIYYLATTLILITLGTK